MKQAFRTALYILLAIFMLATFYAIFYAGSPKSLFRLFIASTSYDIAITVVLSLVVAALVILLTATRREGTLRHLLEINTDYIRQLRQKGKSDEQIAESFLKEMGSQKGLLYTLAKQRVLRYLAKIG